MPHPEPEHTKSSDEKQQVYQNRIEDVAPPRTPNNTSAPDSCASDVNWRDREEQVLPKNNIPLVFFALLLTTFLAALDETIVTTALPTIVEHLKGGQDYSWVGSAYLLATAALSPVYGKVSDIVGRKAVLYPIIVLFLIGSALCGAAQSMTWLVIARAVQGIGGGGILQMTNIVVGDLVPLNKRGAYGSYAGALWGIASVVGPLIGGAITDHASWRWCFWINLPTGGVALALLSASLHFNPLEQDKTFREHVAEFDFQGLILIVAGVVCLLLGFNQSGISWSSPATISLLAVGGTLIVLSALWELYTDRSQIIPPRLFRTRTTAIVLITTFLHAFAFFAAAFYLPVYYQSLGASVTRAGIEILPFSLAACSVSFASGFIINKLGDVKRIMFVSFLVMTLGFGLMIMLDEASSSATKVIYPLIAGLGVGGLFFAPILAMQAAMPVKDMATSTATVGLLRQLGSTVGVSVGQAIWYTELRRRLTASHIDLGTEISAANLADSIRQLKNLQPDSLRTAAEHAYTKSISLIWVVDTPFLGLSAIMVLFLKNYSLERKTRQAGEEDQSPSEEPRSVGGEDVTHSPSLASSSTAPQEIC